MISIWERDTFYRDTDVLIAGGGLMGLWTAFELLQAKPDLKITIADGLPVPALASTRNAGFACFGSPSELWSDMESLGDNLLWSIVEKRYKGIRKIRKVFGDEIIDYDPCGGYEMYLNEKDWSGENLKDRLHHLNKGLCVITGLEHTYTDCTRDLQRFGLTGFSAMAGNHVEGGLHSGRLVFALLQQLQKQGVIFLGGHMVMNMEGIPGSLSATMDAVGKGKVSLNCKAAFWAINAGLSRQAGLVELVQPARGQVLLSPPIQDFSLNGTFHFDEGYYYFRNLGNRLLLGGARNKAFEIENTMMAEPTPEIRNHLEDFIQTHLPQAALAIGKQGWMQWAGIMGMSRDKQPFIKEMQPGIWSALACNGMGVALTPIIAEEASRQLLAALR
jgi:gamma-glutamylputrescine oxidase